MNVGQILELAAGVLLLGGGVWLYRRGNSQSAVILLVIAALVLIHGLGLMEYRAPRTGV